MLVSIIKSAFWYMLTRCSSRTATISRGFSQSSKGRVPFRLPVRSTIVSTEAVSETIMPFALSLLKLSGSRTEPPPVAITL